MEQKPGMNPELLQTESAYWFGGVQSQSSQEYCSLIQHPTTLILNQNLQAKNIESERERDYTLL